MEEWEIKLKIEMESSHQKKTNQNQNPMFGFRPCTLNTKSKIANLL
jgi:hypothetical protein